MKSVCPAPAMLSLFGLNAGSTVEHCGGTKMQAAAKVRKATRGYQSCHFRRIVRVERADAARCAAPYSRARTVPR